MLTDEHTQTSQEFLIAADREFAAGDELQGSEKLWGAASHAIMAVAQRRDMPYGSHRTMINAARRIAEELNDDATHGQVSSQRSSFIPISITVTWSHRT